MNVALPSSTVGGGAKPLVGGSGSTLTGSTTVAYERGAIRLEMYLHDVFWDCRSSIRGCSMVSRANYNSAGRSLAPMMCELCQ